MKLNKEHIEHSIKKITITTANKVAEVANDVVGTTGKVTKETTKKIIDIVEKKKEDDRQKRQKELDSAMKVVRDSVAERVICALGESPVDLSQKKLNN